MAIRIGKKDLLWSYAGYILNTSISIILLPVLLRFLSQKELGLWYTFAALGTFTNLLDFGFSPTIMRNVSYCWSGAKELRKEGIPSSTRTGEPNYELFSVLFTVSKRIYLTIALLSLALLLTVGNLYIRRVTVGLTGWRYTASWYIYSFALVLNIYYKYWDPFLRGVGAIKESQKVIVISKLVQLVISIVGLVALQGLLAVSVAYFFSGLALRQLSRYYFYNYDTKIREKLTFSKTNYLRNDLFKEVFAAVWYNAWRLGLVSIGAFLITQSSTLICSAYLGLETTASYGLSMQLFGLASSFSFVLFNTYLPILNEARLRDDTRRLKRIFSTSVVVGWISYVLIGLSIIFFGNEVLKFIGSKTSLLPKTMLAYMCLYLFLEFNHSMAASFLTTKNTVPFVKAAIVSGIAVLVSSFVLVKFTNLRLWGLFLSQSMVQLAYNNWYWPYIVLKELRMSIFDVFKEAYYIVHEKFRHGLWLKKHQE